MVRGQAHPRVDQPLHQVQSDPVRLSQGDADLRGKFYGLDPHCKETLSGEVRVEWVISTYLVQPAGLLELLLQARQLWQFHVQAAAQVQERLQLGGVGHLVRQRHLGALVEVLYVLQQLLSRKEKGRGGRRVSVTVSKCEVSG